MANERAHHDSAGGRGQLGPVYRGAGVLVGVVAFGLLVASGPLAGGDLPLIAGAAESTGATDEPASGSRPDQPAVDPAEPVELVVRSVGIEAPIRPVEVGEDRELRPPRQPNLVGWWNESAESGASDGLSGSTVIAGHSVHSAAAGQESDGESAGGRPGSGAGERASENADVSGGAMDRLPEVSEGTPVVVRTENGAVRYRVNRVERYSVSELAERAPTIFDQQRRHRLVLVTCEDWNGEEYLSNVVIFAQPLPAAA